MIEKLRNVNLRIVYVGLLYRVQHGIGNSNGHGGHCFAESYIESMVGRLKKG